jgi:undecaprenyl diphosphate synthase
MATPYQSEEVSTADWPRKVYLLSQQVVDMPSKFLADNSLDTPRSDHATSRWIPFVDNASARCPRSDSYEENAVCEDQSILRLVWRVLHWIKRIVLRLTRSYHADTAVLLLLPLVTGIVIGIWLGRRQEKRRLSHRGSFSRWGSFILRWCPPSLLLWVGERIGPSLAELMQSSRGDDPMLTKSSLDSKSASSKKSRPLLQLVKSKNDNFASADSSPAVSSSSFPETEDQLVSREDSARKDLHSDRDCKRESGLPDSDLPRHVAFIMDGNRRYGQETYGNTVAGHWDGSRKVLDVAKWCIAENIPYVTVFAFSTENWKRDPIEVASLMEIFAKYCEELRLESLDRNIRVHILSTDPAPIPAHVAEGLRRLEDDTQKCTGLCMNVCLSYGSRSEVVNACRSVLENCLRNKLDPSTIREQDLTDQMLTRHCPDPDILIRTSGELRISNYLLWQLAYAELFFLEKNWPEVQKDDFLDIIRSYASGRKRRYGK